jgi:hypothetical protein
MGNVGRVGRGGAAVSLLALAVAGCAKPEVPVPVKGKVVDERPGRQPAQLVVTFHPQDELNKGSLPSAVTTKEGTFSLTCLRGRYKVTLAAPPTGHGHADPAAGGGPGPAPAPGKPPAAVPPAYQAPERTPLEVAIPEIGKDDLVLTVR